MIAFKCLIFFRMSLLQQSIDKNVSFKGYSLLLRMLSLHPPVGEMAEVYMESLLVGKGGHFEPSGPWNLISSVIRYIHLDVFLKFDVAILLQTRSYSVCCVSVVFVFCIVHFTFSY